MTVPFASESTRHHRSENPAALPDKACTRKIAQLLTVALLSLAVVPPSGAVAAESIVLTDPESTYTGQQVSLATVMSAAYAAGFRTEEKLLLAVAIAIGESGLWTGARNWHPEQGFRPATDEILVVGPAKAWNADGQQMQSDRGLWQVASYWWPEYTDADTDDPFGGAVAAFRISKDGTDFSLWDSFKYDRIQKHFDEARDGWPALRPLVAAFLANAGADELVVAREKNKLPETAEDVQTLLPAKPEAAQGSSFSALGTHYYDAGELDKAIAAYRLAADAGDGDAKYRLAMMFIRGEAEPDTADEVEGLLHDAAAAGLEGPAYLALALYLRQSGAPTEEIAALEKAVAANDIDARIRLGEMLAAGEGADVDLDRAISLLNEAADAGRVAPASFVLSKIYRAQGDGEAEKSALERAAEAGDVDASVRLAEILMAPDHSVADVERAIQLLEDALSDGAGYPAAKALASIYRETGDVQKELTVLEAAVASGSAEEKFRLAQLLAGRNDGSEDLDRAIKLLDESDELFDSGEEISRSALYLSIGESFMKEGEREKAIASYERAAEYGEPYAELRLGEALLGGAAGTEDIARGIALLERAGSAGMEGPAALILATHYRAVGDTTAERTALEQAVAAGEVVAKLHLAELIISSRPSEQDRLRAVALFDEAEAASVVLPSSLTLAEFFGALGRHEKEAAMLSDLAAQEPRAALRLAQMLIRGEGIKQDVERAVTLLEGAAHGEMLGVASYELAKLFRTSGDHAKEVAALEVAAEAGLPEASLRLGQLLIIGEGTTRDFTRAVGILRMGYEAGPQDFPYVELINTAAARYGDADAVTLTVSLLGWAHATNAELAVETFEGLSDNEKTSIVQELLKDKGSFDGRVDGRLTKATLSSIASYCAKRGITECRDAALPTALIADLLQGRSDLAGS